MLFRTRDLLVRQRTQTINALRGHLAEFGVVLTSKTRSRKSISFSPSSKFATTWLSCITGRTLQYALVDGKRSEARKGAGGTCETCGAQMVPKCGPRVMHHWAHSSRRDCDPWWESETPWHREWKQHFPEDCREVSHVDAEGEIHRADIRRLQASLSKCNTQQYQRPNANRVNYSIGTSFGYWTEEVSEKTSTLVACSLTPMLTFSVT